MSQDSDLRAGGGEAAGSQEGDLRRLVDLARRRWPYLVLPAVVVGLVALSTSLIATPVYESLARIELQSQRTSLFTPDNQRELLDQDLATQVEVIQSQAVAGRVIDELGLDGTPEEVLESVSAGLVGDSRVLAVSVRDPDPQQAATLAQTFAQQFLQHRRARAVQQVQAARSGLEQEAGRLRDRIDQLDPARSVERQRLATRLAQISAQLAAVQSPDAFLQSGGRIIRDAQPPDEPAAPRPVRRTVLGAFLGLMVGGSLAFGREWLDDRVRDRDAVTGSTAGRPVLTVVPAWGRNSHGPLPVLTAPDSPEADAFHRLRTNLRFMAGDEPYGSVVVTSPEEAEGKSVVAANLAMAAASTGDDVVLVGAELRRPGLPAIFDLEDAPGLSSVLTGERELEDVLLEAGDPPLRLLPAGTLPPNPAQLLGTEAMADLMARLAAMADLVVYDVPPVLPVADAVTLSARADAVVFVAASRVTRGRALAQSTSEVLLAGGRLAGTAVNFAAPAVWDDDGGGDRYYRAYPERGAGRRARPGP